MGLVDSLKRATGAGTPERASASGHRWSLSETASGAGAGSARRSSDASRKSTDGKDSPPEDGDDTEVLDEKEGNILLSLISQLRIGMDLHKVALPTFCLEPRSMLERITDFFSHPDLIFGVAKLEDPQERFLAVLRYYLSGWHIKPKGVKKPYNATLGEIFRCSYKYPDGSEGFYVAEQVSHHPPISAYFYISPANGVLIYGELKPRSKFLGNSAASIMEGENRVIIMDRPEDGEYSISMPNMYARGIMFGKLLLELGDTATVKNVKTGINCEAEFKVKGFFSGTYNAVTGKVTGPKGTLGEISGYWHESMDYKDKKTGEVQNLFDAETATSTPKTVAPESEQEPNESRRMWKDLTLAIKNQDMEGAAEAKNAVEEAQREQARLHGGEESHQIRYFELKGEKYVPLCGVSNLPKDRDECVRKIREWIWPDSTSATTPSVADPSSGTKEPTAAAAAAAGAAAVDEEPAVLPTAVPTAPGPPKGELSEHPPSSA